MALRNYLTVIREIWPSKFEDAGLFRYNLGVAIRGYETSAENERLISELFACPPLSEG